MIMKNEVVNSLAEAKKYQQIMQKFYDLDNNLSIRQVYILFTIARHIEGLSIVDISEQTGILHSTVGRDVARLSNEIIRGKTGLGLIQYISTNMDRRIRQLRLTQKGQRFINDLFEIK